MKEKFLMIDGEEWKILNKKNINKIKLKYTQSKPSEENNLKLDKAFAILFEEVLKNRKRKQIFNKK